MLEVLSGWFVNMFNGDIWVGIGEPKICGVFELRQYANSFAVENFGSDLGDVFRSDYVITNDGKMHLLNNPIEDIHKL